MSSIVRYLEHRLGEVERNLPESGKRYNASSSDQSQPSRLGNARNRILQAARLAIGTVCTPALLLGEQGIYYEARLFYASERPPLKIPVRGVYYEEPPRWAGWGSASRLSNTRALTIPFEVAKVLFDNYLLSILHRYPCFAESDLVQLFNQFFTNRNDPTQISSESTCFIVSMILAISSLTSRAQDFQRVVTLSESLHRDAMAYCSFLGETSIRSLQCLLLLAQMSLLLPYTGNLWYMSGEAMRLAIALGLHQEPDRDCTLSSAERELRRRIFWTV
jgi:hypothetical protein